MFLSVALHRDNKQKNVNWNLSQLEKKRKNLFHIISTCQFKNFADGLLWVYIQSNIGEHIISDIFPLFATLALKMLCF